MATVAERRFEEAVRAAATRLGVSPSKAARLVYLYLDDPGDVDGIDAALGALIAAHRLMPAPTPVGGDLANLPRLHDGGLLDGGPPPREPAVATTGTAAPSMPRLGTPGLFNR